MSETLTKIISELRAGIIDEYRIRLNELEKYKQMWETLKKHVDDEYETDYFIALMERMEHE